MIVDDQHRRPIAGAGHWSSADGALHREQHRIAREVALLGEGGDPVLQAAAVRRGEIGGREGDHGKRLRARIGPEGLDHLESGDVGQQEIHDDQRGLLPACELDALAPERRADEAESGRRQDRSQYGGHDRIVVDREHERLCVAGVHLAESPDAFEQAPAVQRLGQILRRPEQQSPLLFGEHGLDDHRDLSCSRIGLQRLEHQQAVFSVEIEIEEDRRRL